MTIKTLHFFIGTKAQFIKMAPLMIEAQKQGLPIRYIDSGQHSQTTQELRKVFPVGDPNIKLNNNHHDIATMKDAFRWALKITLMCFSRRKSIFNKIFDGKEGICLVHGDTLSTLFGVWIARRAGVPVAHVESGLRSFKPFDPFPEELVRLYCMKKCDILFAPSDTAFANLINMGYQRKSTHVHGNTVADAIRIASQTLQASSTHTDYALVTCHRYETISNSNKLAAVVDLINDTSDKIPVTFVTHKPTRNALEKYNLLNKLSDKVKILDMQNYADFLSLIINAKMVLTDGGSIQEECAYLNKPCLIIRNHTERDDGLGKNAVLWTFSPKVSAEFIDKALQHTQQHATDWPEPSREILSKLTEAMS